MDQPTVLIVSDDPEFSGAVTGRWQAENTVPEFTLMGGDLCQDLDPEAFDVAIVGAVRVGIPVVLKELVPKGKPVLVCDESARSSREGHVVVLRKSEEWQDALVVVACEILRRCEAHAALQRTEEANTILDRQATLGRYMLDMRHTLNNSLTSVLGNSELLLLEPGSLTANARSQIETVRNMGLRMHEVLQRFSSLEKELKVVEDQATREGGRKRWSAAAGA